MVSEFLFAWPLAFLVLPLPLLLWLFTRPPSVSARRALKVPDLAQFERMQDLSAAAGKISLMLLLAVLTWLMLVVATARPQWLGPPISSEITGRDLMLCIDISGSMRESDLYDGNNQLSRMDVVRKVGRDFVRRRTGDRIGLIMFGSQAYVQTPLTFDHSTVEHFLGEAEVGLAGRSTAIGDAIGLGIKRLRDRPEQSRVLILLTDGANSAGVVEPLDAASIAADNNIRIHTIGVGSDNGGAVGGLGFRVQRSELDEETLQKIADATGGEYFRARNVRELENIYSIIDKIEPVENDDQVFRPLIELFPWPLGIALGLSAIGAWWYGRRMAL